MERQKLPTKPGARLVRSSCAIRLGASIAALLILVGCNRTGEFGRVPQAEALHDLPAGAGEPGYTASIGSTAALTDDEQQLRDLARGVLASNHSVEAGWRHGLRYSGKSVPESPEAQRRHYADYISRGPFRSVTARYSRLIDDTRDDIARLDPFFQVARRVADLDGKRQRGARALRSLPQPERADTERRVRENMMLMAEVHRTLGERAATYRLALERLVVTAPSPLAIDAERTRLDLERRLTAIAVTAASSTGRGADQPGGTKGDSG